MYSHPRCIISLASHRGRGEALANRASISFLSRSLPDCVHPTKDAVNMGSV